MERSPEAARIVREIRSRLAKIPTPNTPCVRNVRREVSRQIRHQAPKVVMQTAILSGPSWLQGRISDDAIYSWVDSEDLWWRRAALVSTIALSRRGLADDVRRVVAVCTRLVGDREDLVVKSLSWALRELSKKHPEQVRRCIAQHRKVLAARVIREVENKLGGIVSLRMNLAPRQYLDLGLAVKHLHRSGNADHFPLKRGSQPVICRFRPCRDVADESLIRMFCTEIKKGISIFAGVDGDD
jgi:hypothetical protein